METMSEDQVLGYRLIDKEGKVIDNKLFDDFDSLADFMMEQADKYYQGLVDPDTTVEMTTFDNTGKILYQDQASFTKNDEEPKLESLLTELVNERSEDSEDYA
jgi:hypothetical protein